MENELNINLNNQEKDLLLQDLCARLPYGVKCKVFDLATPYTLSGVLPNNGYDELYFEQLDFKESDGYASVKFCKPYLYPLSSMTEEQKEELKVMCDWHDGEEDAQSILVLYHKHFVMRSDVIDWLNVHHFDYRGLIPMGLAKDATGLNIY